MELLEIRYFLETVKAGSLSRAAVVLGISQPSLSRQIQKLERSLRAELFYRHGRGMALTAEGVEFHSVANSVIDQLVNVQSRFQARRRAVCGNIDLGVSGTIASLLAAPLMMRIKAEHPDIRLRIREGLSSVLAEWVEWARVDLAILYESRAGANILGTPLLLEDLFLVEPIGTKCSGPVRLRELADKPLLLPGKDNGLRRVVDESCRMNGVELRWLAEIDCVDAAKQLVAAGHYATVLPSSAVHREVTQGLLSARPFQNPGLQVLLIAATPANKPVTPLIRVVLRDLRAEVTALCSAGVFRGSTRKGKSRSRSIGNGIRRTASSRNVDDSSAG
jgi:LysR family transcriptional regulator, nitrogen assimilation regulatory protein